MKRSIQYLILGFLSLFLMAAKPCTVAGQSANTPYTIQGDEVVFVFDIREYKKALTTSPADKVDFSDLNIYDVAVTGNFSDWSQKGWRMEKKGDFLFELRKKLEDFNESFPIEFKYIINGRILADPVGLNPNQKEYSNDFLNDVYNVDLSVFKISDNGNTIFQLGGHTNANEVILAGSFNGWNETAIKMKKGTDGWYLRGNLPPGRYEYKFIADKEWLHDPAANENIVNEHGTLNSVLYVTENVQFTLEGFPNARKVILTGSFDKWDENKFKMVLDNGIWKFNLPLPGGKHHYKFIIDGQWITDPSNPIVEDDGYGNLNSVLFVH